MFVFGTSEDADLLRERIIANVKEMVSECGQFMQRLNSLEADCRDDSYAEIRAYAAQILSRIQAMLPELHALCSHLQAYSDFLSRNGASSGRGPSAASGGAVFTMQTTQTPSRGYSSTVRKLNKAGVAHRPIQAFGRERTSYEIAARLGGGDLTKGSCSSLAFAYAGNRAGYDVLDFRDGDSRSFFASNYSILRIAQLQEVKSVILYGRNEVECTGKLLQGMQEGKEYYLAVGQHAAIVRKTGGNTEYLELQHTSKNGWHPLGKADLIHRFGCAKHRFFQFPHFLIDVDSLGKSPEFLDILGFINTDPSQQRKGVRGHVR